MTLQEALDMTVAMKPTMMKGDVLIKHLSDLEGMIWEEILMKHAHTQAQETKPVYTEETDTGTELLVPDPYSKVYWIWLMTRIDIQNQENERFNSDMVLFDAAYQEMSDWWTRTYRPIQRIREFRL